MSDDLDPELLALLLSTFKVELEELSQDMTQSLLALERNAPDLDRGRCLDGLFRNAHNIKGAARGVNVDVITEIAHHLESLFSRLKQGKAEPTPTLINLCLQSLDSMHEAMVAFEAGQPVRFDVAALVARLEASETGRAGEASAHDAGRLPSDAAPTADPAKPLDPSVTQLAGQERPGGPDSAASSSPREGPEITRVALARLERVSTLTEELMASRLEIEDHLATVAALRQTLDDRIKQVARSHRIGGQARHASPTPLRHEGRGHTDEDMKHLQQTVQTLYQHLRGSSNRLGLLSESLQEEVRTLRLVPVSTLLRPLSRPVRDIALQLGKPVDYTVVGDDIQMDRPILEGIKDPLIHLLRNAIDHGIEAPELRRAAGKPETGRIDVKVQLAGNRVLLTVQDDGAGINVARIARAAVRKKLISSTEAKSLSVAETLDLIFRPGFSSKEIITDISGRGVGLDVVLSNLRNLNGNVQVDTAEGRGTCFTLSLPLTLTTDRGLMVRLGHSQFAIPSTAVDRVMEIDASGLLDVEASQVVLLNGKPVPARELSQVLEMPVAERPRQTRLPVVVVSRGWHQVALLVDEIVGEREIVIKRLRPPLVSIRNVTGGTLTGSGKVIMVLNPTDLVASALHGGATRRIALADAKASAPKHILVVDDSITTRTLEKNVLENHGFRVTVAVDGRLGWAALQNEAFDLVLTDVEMPHMDGFELATRIKQSERFRETPVVIVTSLASESDRRRGVEAGADAYIVKGQFETRKLLDVIHQLL